MLINPIKFFQKLLILSCISIFCINYSNAQIAAPSTEYTVPKVYQIGDIKVIGNDRSDSKSIVTISGLRVGESIVIPGTDIQYAIDKLWQLKLFTKVDVFVTETIGEIINLEINVQERQKVAGFEILGVKKGYVDEITEEVEKIILPGTIITENLKVKASKIIEDYHKDKGYNNITVAVSEKVHPIILNSSTLIFDVDKKQKVRIQTIQLTGNKILKDAKILKLMKKTKMKKKLFATSKYLKEDYKADKKTVIDYYNSLGYRDARITKDSISVLPNGNLAFDIHIQEGNQYHIRNIVFKGNSIYSNETLQKVLGFEKGDIYNAQLLESKLRFSQDGSDVSSLYLDNGYLFFNLEPIEVAIINDSIDLDINIFEGKKAVIDEVIINGNSRTHEHVVRRELRTVPGQTFSRADIIRSQREIMNMGYFNAENIQIATPVDPKTGTVDIVYTLEEKSSDQLELSAGWGGRGRGVVGTLGVTFSNFSLRNIADKSTWSPLPQGDGQRLSIRAQSNGRFYQSYNLSFTEPWLGGNKPRALTVAGYHTRSSSSISTVDGSDGVITLSGGSLSLGTRLKFPDDYFISNTGINYKGIKLINRNGFSLDDGTSVSNGLFNTISLTQTITRNSIDEPLYPRSGSNISLSLEATPPYSLFSDKNISELSVAERYKFLEFHKWKFKADWYTTLTGKLVLRARAKMGFLGGYNTEIGLTPFERFELGGDGLTQGTFVEAKDIFSLRGYDVSDINPSNNGAAVFNKYTIELRYPFSLKPSASIYGLTFLEGGNSWSKFGDFDPFDLKRSVGVGLRLFLPIFGTVGFDYGVGFDKNLNFDANISDYGTFNIILGFEPE